MKNNDVNSVANTVTTGSTEAPSPGSLPTLLSDFEGRWELSRTILQSNGDTFSFKGEAKFVRHNMAMLYQEDGYVTAPNGYVMPAQRHYIWQQASANKFEVLFDDGRYFHSFSALEPNAKHLCGDDLYTVNYQFSKWPTWSSKWQVKGPRKDYEMHSFYKRITTPKD